MNENYTTFAMSEFVLCVLQVRDSTLRLLQVQRSGEI